MSAVTAVSQRYTGCRLGVRKWCDGGRDKCFMWCEFSSCERHGYCLTGRLD